MLNTLTTDCFSFSGLPFYHKGISRARQSARNGESSLSGENSSASLRKGAMYSFCTSFILERKIAMSSLYLFSSNTDFFMISSLCSSSSRISPSGEYSIKSGFNNRYLDTEFFTMVEKTMLVSITSSIYTSFLYTFSHMPLFTFLPSTKASSSVNMLSDAMDSSSSSSAPAFLIASPAMPAQSIEACLRIKLLRSSGRWTVSSVMYDKMAAMDNNDFSLCISSHPCTVPWLKKMDTNECQLILLYP